MMKYILNIIRKLLPAFIKLATKNANLKLWIYTIKPR